MARGGAELRNEASCSTLAFARAVFKVAIEKKLTSQFMIRSSTRVVKRRPERPEGYK
jgi:hypothetical protein